MEEVDIHLELNIRIIKPQVIYSQKNNLINFVNKVRENCSYLRARNSYTSFVLFKGGKHFISIYLVIIKFGTFGEDIDRLYDYLDIIYGYEQFYQNMPLVESSVVLHYIIR